MCPVGCFPIPEARSYESAPSRTSLASWSHSRRLLVLDRAHSSGDRYFDRGVFRHVTPQVDREYALDLMAYRFRPSEDARWLDAGGGLRMRAGSVRRDLLAIKTHIKTTVPLDDGDRHFFSIEGVLQEDPQVSRSLLEMSYAYRLAPHHAVGVRHTFSRYKEDLDLTPFYSYASRSWGRAEVAFTLQDVYNNFIYEQLGINSDIVDVLRIYESKPYLLEARYASPEQHRLGGEIVVGWQPERRAVYASQKTPSYQFLDDERLHYLSALLEYRLDPVAVGVYFQRDATRLRRQSTGDSLGTDYRARQTHQRLGAFVKGAWGNVRGAIYAFTGFYNDKQTGDNFETSVLERPINFDTEQSGLHSRLVYEPNGWPYFGVEYLAFRRDLGPNPRALVNDWTFQYWDIGPSNYRVVGLIGYRFSRGSVAMGIGYDTDGDPNRFKPRPPKYFDNGFFRFTLVW